MNRSRLSQEDIADDILASGASVPKESIISTWKLINNAVTCRIAEGISVDTGLGLLRPSINGSFDSANSDFDRKKHSITVQYRPGKQLAEILSSLTPVIAQGGHIQPEITDVRDKSMPTEKSDMLSPGGFLVIRGKNIMVLDREDGPDDDSVGVYFDNQDDPEKSVRLSPEQIYHNSSTLLEGIIPRLEPGIYKVRVATRYCGRRGRKGVQEHSFAKEFLVTA